MNLDIQKDILDWVINYIEVNHEFYDYKFPPCPYAKAARLKNLIEIIPYTSGNYFKFAKAQTIDLDNKTIKILVFPRKCRWYYHLHFYLRRLNRKLVLQDRFIQYGSATSTSSKYPGLKGPYFIAIINKLSDVTQGHKQLLKTDYYSYWDRKHYNEVVARRNKLLNK